MLAFKRITREVKVVRGEAEMAIAPQVERIVRPSPATFTECAPSTVALVAWLGSGAAKILPVRAKPTADSNAARCPTAVASITPWSFRKRSSGALPWKRSRQAWLPAGMNE